MRVITFEVIVLIANVDTLSPGVGSHGDDVAEATAGLAGTVRTGLQSPESARRVASVCARLLGDSWRKSMEAMCARLSDPGTYQAFQHFISHAPWEAETLWKRLRERVPERIGVLILDTPRAAAA